MDEIGILYALTKIIVVQGVLRFLNLINLI